MHTATQIIAQRAPPATRTTKAARWQPYYSLQATTTPSLPVRSHPSNTLASPNISSPAPKPKPTPRHQTTHVFSSDVNRSRLQIPTPSPQVSKETIQRDPYKDKSSSTLIDQTVRILSDIWHPQDIPACFLPPGTKMGPLPTSPPTHLQSALHTLNSKGASSSFPSSQSSATQPPSDRPPPTNVLPESDSDSEQAILPLKNFVLEVLRRSRTSGTILQTALCYLEALRLKVPEILQQENVGIRPCFQPDSLIQPATPEELEREAELRVLEDAIPIEPTPIDPLQTIRVGDSGPEELEGSQHTFEDESSGLLVQSASFSSSPFTSLPSPLLCPRRAFLASLILASKFSQDKSYSNRAWAKLSGLPPREVGRCERALGQALQWRLWVGKTPASVASQSESLAPDSLPTRSVSRSQSESSVTLSKPFLVENPGSDSNGYRSELPVPNARPSVGLRRCSTLPQESSSKQLCPAPQLPQETLANLMDVYTDKELISIPAQLKGSPDPTTPGLIVDSPSSIDCFDDNLIRVSETAFGSLKDNLTETWLNGGTCGTESSYINGHCGYTGLSPIVVNPDTSAYGSSNFFNLETSYIFETAGVH